MIRGKISWTSSLRIKMYSGKKVLDVCCGGRMFYKNKQDERVLFCDKRELETTLCDGRKFVVKPDMLADFRNLPFDDESFALVVFDPPHLLKVGDSAYMALKYGKLTAEWKAELGRGFDECWRRLTSSPSTLPRSTAARSSMPSASPR